MFPVLFSIGKISISSFGVFLALGFLWGIFLVWRLGRAWDLNEEKTLDLTLLTVVGGLLGARLYFAIEQWQYFSPAPFNIFLINKVPGFSFWGGFLGGWLTLYFFAKRFKINFWQAADIASVGLLGGLVLSGFGCFLGACNVGIPAKSFLAVSMAGFLGTRFPVQLLESLLLVFILHKIWSKATHFHQRGKIVSLSFIYIGLIRFILEPLKQTHSSAFFSLILFLLGLTIYYKVTKQSPVVQIKTAKQALLLFMTDTKYRKILLQNLRKSWYNKKVSFTWKIKNVKKFLRRSNVKLS